VKTCSAACCFSQSKKRAAPSQVTIAAHLSIGCSQTCSSVLGQFIVRHPRRQQLTYINPHAFKRTSETTSDTAIEPTQPSRLEKNTNIAHLNYAETGLRAALCSVCNRVARYALPNDGA